MMMPEGPTRRAVLRGGAALVGSAAVGCGPSLVVPPPLRWPAAEDVRLAVSPNEYVLVARVPAEGADTLLGKPVVLLRMGGVAIDMDAEVIAGTVSRSLHEQPPVALQVNHQRAYLTHLDAREGSSVSVYDDTSCRWDASSITRVYGAVETLTLEPSAFEAASPSTPYILSVTSGPRANSETSCGLWREPLPAVVTVRVGGTAGPPGSAELRWEPLGGKLDLSCSITPWTRIAVHGRDAASPSMRLLWASDRYEFLRASRSNADPLDPPYGTLDYRRRLGVGLAEPTRVEATFLSWEVPDVPRSSLVDGRAWTAFIDGLAPTLVRRVALPLG